jgi:hypothetical protein
MMHGQKNINLQHTKYWTSNCLMEQHTKVNVRRLLFHISNGLKKETISCVQHVICGVQDINTLQFTVSDIVLDSLMITL